MNAQLASSPITRRARTRARSQQQQRRGGGEPLELLALDAVRAAEAHDHRGDGRGRGRGPEREPDPVDEAGHPRDAERVVDPRVVLERAGQERDPDHSRTPPATAAQPTIRQRGVGGRPVGNSSGSATSTSRTAGTQAQFATHRPNSATTARIARIGCARRGSRRTRRRRSSSAPRGWRRAPSRSGCAAGARRPARRRRRTPTSHATSSTLTATPSLGGVAPGGRIAAQSVPASTIDSTPANTPAASVSAHRPQARTRLMPRDPLRRASGKCYGDPSAGVGRERARPRARRG